MPIETKLIRAAYDDIPGRCQAVAGKTQCPYMAEPGGPVCIMHGGANTAIANSEAQQRNYRVAKWQARINEKADNGQVKSLREEIGILRIILEETLQSCHTEYDLIINSSKIADIVMKIEKVVISCNKLESNLGLLLDKQAAMQLSGEMVEIIARYVKDEAAIDAISNAIGEAVSRSGKPGTDVK